MDTEEIQLEGRRLAGRYVLQDQIAAGGMGTVWRARDEVLGRFVAVKVLHDRLAKDPDTLERFRLEAVAAARLSHPAVVRVFDTGIDDGVCFIVMELFEGRTLEDMLAREGALDPARAVRIVRHVLDALAHAHREGVVHRDVKPGNILVDDSLVKVMDFGIAKAAFADDLSTTGNLLGTVSYLAPEQVEGGPADARTDLYSVGVVLYEALTGRPPFRGDSHVATAAMRLSTDPVPPRALRAGIPREIDEAVMRALRRHPDDRFQSAEEMRSALDRIVPAAASVRREPRARAEPAGTSSGMRSWLLIPLLVLLGAAVAVGVWWLLTGLIQNADEGAPGEAASSLTRLDIASVSSYDPLGDESENDDVLPAVLDGNEETAWTTDGYTTPQFGNLKDGVGLVLGLDQPAELARLRVLTDTTGITFDVYASSQPDSFDLESPIAGATAEEEITAIPLEPTEAAYVLVWFTELADDGSGAYRARVIEVAVFARG
jgi:hypothetical protein